MEYTIGADVAKGTGGEQEGAEGDWSVAQVLDRHKRQVGVWRGKVEPDYFAVILYHMGELLNWARLAIEFNNHGILPNTLLFKRSEERRVGKECVSMCRSRFTTAY